MDKGKVLEALNELSKMQLAIKNTLSMKNKVKKKFTEDIEIVKGLLNRSLKK